MFRISFTACSFYFRKSQSDNFNVYNLNDPYIYIYDDGREKYYNNVIDLFAEFFENFQTTVKDDLKQKTFRVKFETKNIGECKSFKYFYITIYSGNYGSSSDIVDIDTQKIKYRRKNKDADVKPFILFFVIPKDNIKVKVQKGMMFFQNVGPFGVKTITTKYMQSYFKEKTNITLHCATISPELFIRKIFDQYEINKMYLIKNHKSTDTADNLYIGYGKETRELTDLKLEKNSVFKKVKDFINGKTNLYEFENQWYDNVKLGVRIQDSQRTINLHNLDKLSIIESIPDKIIGKDGHPKVPELIDYFLEVANDYLKDLVLKIE